MSILLVVSDPSLTCLWLSLISRLRTAFNSATPWRLTTFPWKFSALSRKSITRYKILSLSPLLMHTHRAEVINGDLTGYLFNKGNKPKHKEGWLKKEFLNKLQEQQLIFLFCKQGLTVIFLTLATSQIYLWTSCPEIIALLWSRINIQGTQPHGHTEKRR